MKLSPLDYRRPGSLKEAIQLLAENEGAKVISGGQSLMPVMAFRLAAPTLLVDIAGIAGLDRIDIDADGVHLGARVRWVDIEKDGRLAAAHPLLAAAIEHVAHYQVRNRGTVGGSVSHADPAAEMPGIAIACDATIEIQGPGGARREAAASFIDGPLQTLLEEDEIVTAVHLPPWRSGRRWAFQEFARRRGDFALAGVLLFFDVADDGVIVDPHVGGIGIGDTALRLSACEEALAGRALDERTIADVVEAARVSLDPPTDLHASGDYRRSLYASLLERCLRRCMAWPPEEA